jgi:1-acyl-sn-glycerol-3-phosphate acyltransferase
MSSLSLKIAASCCSFDASLCFHRLEEFCLSAIQIVVLAALLLLIVWIILARSFKMTLAQYVLYAYNWGMARIVWRLRVVGKFPADSSQGYLIVANHRSSADPMLLQAAIARPLTWMIAREYAEAPAIGWLLRIIGIIPVSRGGGDRGSVKTAITTLREGSCIGIFPEGRINTTDQPLLPSHAGVGLIALRAKVPIVPCWVEGAPYKGNLFSVFFMRANARVHIGREITSEELAEKMKNIETDKRDDNSRVTLVLMQEMLRLAGLEPHKAVLQTGEAVPAA